MDLARVRRVLGSAVLGFTVFGLWAYWANHDHPDHRLRAGLAQGAFSFGFSLLAMSITEATYLLMARRRGQAVVAVAVPTFTSVACAALVHLAAHTPEVLRTLAAPALIGALYQALYVRHLQRLDAAATAPVNSAGHHPETP